MRYFFSGKVEKVDDRFCIRIPFNVWEVSKYRDIIKGDMILDNQFIYCDLIPEAKGIYDIQIQESDLAHIDMDKEHKIILHIPGTLIRIDQNSPYSFENPIRNIDGIDIIKQPADGLCGQSCVAMLAGVTIAEVISVMSCQEWQATMSRMISALNYYGLNHSDIIVFTEGKGVTLPKCCIMMERMGRFCHYLLHFDGKFYDSSLGILEEYDMSKLLGYLEVKV